MIEALSRMSINAAKAAAKTTKKITIVNKAFLSFMMNLEDLR